MSDSLTTSSADSRLEARTSPEGEQLALGAIPHDASEQASQAGICSVDAKRRRRRARKATSTGCKPFVTAVNTLLAETYPYYAKSTQDERRRKFRRIYVILEGLKAQGLVKSTNPEKITEEDIGAFVGCLKANLDATTGSHYLKFLDEVLQSKGNNVVSRLKVKRRNLLPKVGVKSIRIVPTEVLDRLLSENWTLEDPWWHIVARTAIALYAHTGLRSSELRLAKLTDLDFERWEICVSSPKGMGRWANGTEVSPIMPGCEGILTEYIHTRKMMLDETAEPFHEALFPFVSKNGKVSHWSTGMWSKLKNHIELASGARFRWKDFRPTLAQSCKDAGAPIEAISKVLRHSSSKTTEQYYARIRPESAFSQVKAAWQARKPLQADIQKVQNWKSASKMEVG